MGDWRDMNTKERADYIIDFLWERDENGAPLLPAANAENGFGKFLSNLRNAKNNFSLRTGDPILEALSSKGFRMVQVGDSDDRWKISLDMRTIAQKRKFDLDEQRIQEVREWYSGLTADGEERQFDLVGYTDDGRVCLPAPWGSMPTWLFHLADENRPDHVSHPSHIAALGEIFTLVSYENGGYKLSSDTPTFRHAVRWGSAGAVDGAGPSSVARAASVPVVAWPEAGVVAGPSGAAQPPGQAWSPPASPGSVASGYAGENGAAPEPMPSSPLTPFAPPGTVNPTTAFPAMHQAALAALDATDRSLAAAFNAAHPPRGAARAAQSENSPASPPNAANTARHTR
jgi:hypothetical protein